MSESLANIAESVTEETEMIDRLRYTWQRDIEKISAALNEYANENDWCSTYENVLDEVNESLTYHLSGRNREWTFDVSGDGTAKIAFTIELDVPTSIDPNETVYTFNDFVKEFMHNNSWRLPDLATDVELIEFERHSTYIDGYNEA